MKPTRFIIYQISFGIKLYMFRTVPLSINRTSVLILLASCQQTSMTYTIAVCTVKKLLMMDRGTVRIM